MRPLYTDWEHVNGVLDALERLRPLIIDKPKSLEFFDEEIDHDEWGIAFCVIVDHLLDPSTPPASPETLKLIDFLDREMKMNEEADKLHTIRAKASATGS